MKDKIVDANMERNKGSFSETVFEAVKLIHQANEGDSFFVRSRQRGNRRWRAC